MSGPRILLWIGVLLAGSVGMSIAEQYLRVGVFIDPTASPRVWTGVIILFVIPAVIPLLWWAFRRFAAA